MAVYGLRICTNKERLIENHYAYIEASSPEEAKSIGMDLFNTEFPDDASHILTVDVTTPTSPMSVRTFRESRERANQILEFTDINSLFEEQTIDISKILKNYRGNRLHE